MDRRAFLAGAAVATATVPVVANAQTLDPNAGTTVTVRGYLKRVTKHIFSISQDNLLSDPKTTKFEVWPSTLIRVYPKDVTTMTLGLVTIRGQLTQGRQVDTPTGTVSMAVLTAAVMA